LLCDILAGKVTELETAELNQSAEPELARIVRAIGIDVTDYDEQKWVAAIQVADLTTPAAQALKMRVDSYRSQFGSTAFARRAGPVLTALRKRAETYSN
jgi:hypothetical protein